MGFSIIFLIHVDDMSVDMLCSDFRDFRAKSVGAVSKNVFFKNRPEGGAIWDRFMLMG